MYVILDTGTWRHVLVYVDHLIIFPMTPKEPMKHVRSVLHLIREVGVTLKLKKCHLISDAIDYLEHVITPICLHVATKTDDAIHSMKCPTCTTELQTFFWSE